MRAQMGIKNFDRTRWIALAASVLIMSTLGLGYVWSLLVEPMIELRGATDAGMASVYTALTLSGALLTIVGGKCVEKFGSTKVIISAIITCLIAHIIFSFGNGIASFAFEMCIRDRLYPGCSIIERYCR